MAQLDEKKVTPIVEEKDKKTDEKEDKKDEKAKAAAASAAAEDEDDDDPRKVAARKEAAKLQAVLHYAVKEPVVHKVLIRNNLLIVEPPLPSARLALVKELNTWMSVICQLPRLRVRPAPRLSSLLLSLLLCCVVVATECGGWGGVVVQSFWSEGDEKAQAAARKDTKDEHTFRTLVSLVPTTELNRCFEKIEDKVSRAHKYVQTWLEYQALWDMDIESVTNELGVDMRRWEQLLLDMKRSRATFDTSASSARFGPILVEYRTVMTKVNNKYDQWHKTILSRFGQLLGDSAVKLNGTLSMCCRSHSSFPSCLSFCFLLTSHTTGNARKQLETFTLDFTSTEKIVNSVTLLQELNKKSKGWAVELETQGQVEKLLERQRFVFPTDWLSIERISGEWNSFSQILARKLAKMNEEAPAIQSKIAAEDLALGRRVDEFAADWKLKRPIKGDLEHAVVANLLMTFDAGLKK
jgi:dynein heavy chain 1